MSNCNDIDQMFPIGYTIDYSPVADPNPPEIGGTFKFLYAARTRPDRKIFDAFDNPGSNRMIKSLKFLAR